jgi:membrane protease YdiL (CAAX protease family)
LPVTELLWWSSQLLWLVVSVVLLLKLRVFDPRSLAAAPARRSNLSILSVAGVILFYFGTAIATFVVIGAFYRPARAAATAPRPALTGPATTSAPATAAATSAPATTAAASAPAEDPQAAMVTQLADAFTKILPVLLIVALCHKLVAGGIDGWGLSLRKIPRGIAYGVLGLLMIYPLLVVINIIVSLLIEHFQKRAETTHETLQLIGRHDISSWERVAFVVVAGVFAPILEEIFFRGLLQTVLREKGWGFLPYESTALAGGADPSEDKTLSSAAIAVRRAWDAPSARHRWAVILVTSFIFAFIHLMPDSFLVLFVLAIGLGYLYERTGNLWACITLHAAFNCLNMYLYAHSGA